MFEEQVYKHVNRKVITNSVALSKEIDDKITELQISRNVSRSTILRELIERGLQQ